MKIYINELGHTTNMAAMPIYGKNLKKSSSKEPNDRWPWNLVCSLRYLNSTKIVQMMTLTFLRKVKYGKMLIHRISWKVLKILA